MNYQIVGHGTATLAVVCMYLLRVLYTIVVVVIAANVDKLRMLAPTCADPPVCVQTDCLY